MPFTEQEQSTRKFESRESNAMKSLLTLIIALFSVILLSFCITASAGPGGGGSIGQQPVWPDAPWKIPLSGVARGGLIDYATVCDATHPYTNLDYVGQGTVTAIRMVFEGGTAAKAQNMTNVLMHIAYDGGTDQANIPWTYLVGLCWTNFQDYIITNSVHTEFFDIDDLTPTSKIDFTLKYLMNFSSRITIWTTCSTDVNLASTVDYQDVLTPSPYSGLRFHVTNAVASLGVEAIANGTIAYTHADPTHIIGTGTRFDATNVGHYFITDGLGIHEVSEPLVTAVADTTHATISWGTMQNNPVVTDQSGKHYLIPIEVHFFKRPAGTSGFVASVFQWTTNWLVMPNNRYTLNQETTPTHEWWDTEQQGGANEGFSFRSYQSSETGQTIIHQGIQDVDTTGVIWEDYRHYYRRPIRYSNGCDFEQNHMGDGMDGGGSAGTPYPARINHTVVYYE